LNLLGQTRAQVALLPLEDDPDPDEPPPEDGVEVVAVPEGAAVEPPEEALSDAAASVFFLSSLMA